MVTIDERRRVAEGLRFSVGKNPMTMPQAGRLIISNMCPYGFTSWNDILLNLADLIDPGLAEAKDEVNEVNVDREALLALAEGGTRAQVLFVEAHTATLLRRYAATRRPHPLERGGFGLEAAIAAERDRLRPLREMADFVVDTSRLSIHDLRRIIQKRWTRGPENLHPLRVNLLSFGFKYGIPAEADFVFDMRFLANPYFDENLREKSGKDKAVADYVFAAPAAVEFRNKLTDLVLYMLPLLETEGRYRVTLAVGCTGGRHRSVAMAEYLRRVLRQSGYAVSMEHRHLELG